MGVPVTDPLPRFIALGASNLQRGFPEFLRVAQDLAGGPVEVLTALGHGRSYGMWSSVLFRALPGITKCQLWSQLADLPPTPTTAMVTDVGNDLLYEIPPQKLLEWVDECIGRLCDAGVQVVLTELPIGNLEKLGHHRYLLFRTLFVPRCRLSLEDLAKRAYKVNDGLIRIANSRDVTIEPLPSQWYGIDPIHLQRQKILLAWKKILVASGTHWSSVPTDHDVTNRKAISLRLRASTNLARPAERRLAGFTQRHSQPFRVFADGTRVLWF